MEQKFILTSDGYLRLGVVKMHKDLLQECDICIGGGFYQFDYASGRLLLDRESFDFGKPRWHLLDGKLKVPKEYRGLHIVYDYDDRYSDILDVSREFSIEYV